MPTKRSLLILAIIGLLSGCGEPSLPSKAQSGDAVAQYEYGQKFLEGIGPERDEEEAKNWLRKSAMQGYAPAQYLLAGRLPIHSPERLELLTKAAGQEHTQAAFDLSMIYEIGVSVPRDEVKSAALLEKWEKQADARDMLNLSYSYAWGWKGMPKDSAKAFKWCTKAAEKESVEAQFELGVMYSEGINEVTKNAASAVKWFRKAAEQGHAKAQYNLGVIFSGGRGVAQDFTEAYAWFNLAYTWSNLSHHSVSDADRLQAKAARDELEKLLALDLRVSGQKRAAELQKEIESNIAAKAAGK